MHWGYHECIEGILLVHSECSVHSRDMISALMDIAICVVNVISALQVFHNNNDIVQCTDDIP